MKLIDIVIIAALAIIIFFAVRRTVRTRKSGGCGCGCAGCDGSGCGPRGTRRGNP